MSILPNQSPEVVDVNTFLALCERLEASLTAATATRRRLLDAPLAEALAPAVGVTTAAAAE